MVSISNNNRQKRRLGFTLVELQVSLFIALITLLAAMSLYIFYWRTFVIGNTVLDIYANSRVAMEMISRDVRMAAQVVSSHTPYTTTSNCAVLKVPSIDASGNVIASHYDYITYKLQGSDLYRIVQKDSLSSRLTENRVVAHYCSALWFSSGGVMLSDVSNLSAINTISIFLPLNTSTISLSGGGTVTPSINPTTLVRMRNK